ncbi:MAG: thiosulfate sulfurtransferase, partial [Alphaproteobacteria bacterium]|nr:thiosulfate sulfurtransferase [Alphaproteobacteria bacterium]
AGGDLAEATGMEVKILEGGTDAWQATGFELVDGFENMASANDDVWYKPYDHDGEVVAEHMRNYLTWETELVEQIERDGTARFRRFD